MTCACLLGFRREGAPGIKFADRLKKKITTTKCFAITSTWPFCYRIDREIKGSLIKRCHRSVPWHSAQCVEWPYDWSSLPLLDRRWWVSRLSIFTIPHFFFPTPSLLSLLFSWFLLFLWLPPFFSPPTSILASTKEAKIGVLRIP